MDGANPRKLLSAEGEIWGPNISPDNKRMVFTINGAALGLSIVVSNPDGSGQRAIVNSSERRAVGCAHGPRTAGTLSLRIAAMAGWIFGRHKSRPGWLQRAHPPVQLTNGPLSYRGPMPSRDGRQIFAMGIKQRGELVRYDVSAKRFVPILSGISALQSHVLQ